MVLNLFYTWAHIYPYWLTGNKVINEINLLRLHGILFKILTYNGKKIHITQFSSAKSVICWIFDTGFASVIFQYKVEFCRRLEPSGI
jgi:hypothetical protein